jgi:hypothetical protein
MTITVAGIFYLIALICFCIAIFYNPPRGSLVAAGLALLSAGLLIGASGL